LTFAVWDLARFPDFRKRVAEEVAKFFPSREDMTAVGLEELPFLNAFLKESMRFHSISVSSNRRVSPAEGAAILGHHLPGRVRFFSYWFIVRLRRFVTRIVRLWILFLSHLQRISILKGLTCEFQMLNLDGFVQKQENGSV